MNLLKRVAPFLIVLAIGYHFGAGSTDPKIEKQTVYKDRVVHDTKTVKVYKPWPDSCLQFQATVPAAIVDLEEQTASSGELQAILFGIGAENGIDTDKYNAYVIRARELDNVVNHDAIKLTYNTDKLNRLLSLCLKDLKS